MNTKTDDFLCFLYCYYSYVFNFHSNFFLNLVFYPVFFILCFLSCVFYLRLNLVLGAVQGKKETPDARQFDNLCEKKNIFKSVCCEKTNIRRG